MKSGRKGPLSVFGETEKMSGRLLYSRAIILCPVLLAIFSVTAVKAQTTAFSYQGRLTSNSSSANGSYDFIFVLYDALTGGNQVVGGIGKQGVTVTNGLFTVSLDFGSSAFPDADRFLGILARPHSADPNTPQYIALSPRQQISSTPYAIRAQSAASADNAIKLGGVSSSQYVTTTNGSTNFIQNQSASPQSANFNVGGSGTVGGAFSANTVSSSSSSNLIFNGLSSSTVGSWLRLNNSSHGGHNWNIISTGSGNGEGAGKLLFNDQTSGGSLMQLDNNGLVVAGNSTVNGNLTVNGTLNATVTTSNFAGLPNCKARQTSAQTFVSGTFFNVRLDETQFCSGITFDNVNDRLVIVTPGVYQVSAELVFVNNGNGVRFLSLIAAGREVSALSINAVTGTRTALNCMSLVRLNAGDFVSLVAEQGSGGNLNTDPFDGRSASLSVNWVGP